MTHTTRPAGLSLAAGLFALALLHGGPFAAQTLSFQSPAPQAGPSTGGAAAGDPVTKEWLLDALRSRRLGEEELARQIEGRGASFIPNADEEGELRAAGATARVLEALRKSFRQLPLTGGGPFPPAGGGPGHGGGPVDYSRPFRANEVTRKALILSKPEPGYTSEARENDVEGVVRLRAVLAASGRVTNISVVKGLPDGLTEKAISAARQVRFTPAQKDGRVVSQYVILEYRFITFHREDEVDVRAVILDKPEAEYTAEARRNGTRGRVALAVTLTSFGIVTVNSVEAGLPHGLTEKAVAAAERIKFKPALLKGRPVSQVATVEYLFGN